MPITARNLFLRGTVSPERLQMVEREFFSSLFLDVRVSKMTWENRLDDVTEALIDLCRVGGNRPLDIADIGMSSGVSTLEMLNAFKASGFTVTVTGTDYCLYGYLVRVRSGLYALVQRNGYPLQYDLWGYGIRPWCRRRYIALGWPLVLRAAHRALNSYLRSIDFIAMQERASLPNGPIIAKVALVSGAVRASNEIRCLEDNLLGAARDDLLGKFDVVRAANLLNRLSFSPDQLRSMVSRIRSYLRGPEALLVVCRSHADQTNHGSYFRLTPKGTFELVRRIGEGSEIEALVLGCGVA